jgi:hypothetical protein
LKKELADSARSETADRPKTARTAKSAIRKAALDKTDPEATGAIARLFIELPFYGRISSSNDASF